MKNKITPIYTGGYKFVSPLHHYDEALSTEDVVVVVSDPYESIFYIVIDNKQNKVLVRESLACTTRIKKVITDVESSIDPSYLSIQSIFGVYDTVTRSYKRACIFVVLAHTQTLKNYLVQINVKDHDVDDIHVVGAPTYYNTSNIYFDSLVTTNVLVNDSRSVRDTDVYITYMDTSVQGTETSTNLSGIHVLFTYEDIAEFEATTGTKVPSKIYPIIDERSAINRTFFKVNSDVERIKLNFSTGVGFIQFKG